MRIECRSIPLDASFLHNRTPGIAGQSAFLYFRKAGVWMSFLIAHPLLLYLLSLLLSAIAYAVIDKPEFEAVYCLLTAVYAALPELIAVSGIRFYQNGNTVPAVIAAVLCGMAVTAAVLLFLADCKGHANGYLPARAAGIGSGILGAVCIVLCCIAFAGDHMQIILTACCLCGMVSVAFICGYLTAFGKGMGKP